VVVWNICAGQHPDVGSGTTALPNSYLSALAVIDDDRRVKGVVEREQLMSKLILSLIDDATSPKFQ
jgi:CBS-domain-containing membrane protein